MSTVQKTIAGALDDANPNNIADLLAKVKLGVLLSPQKQTITQTTAVTVALDPPALCMQAVRVTGGTALAGTYQVSDAAATEVDSATLGVCTISDDGATLTFAVAVTDLIVSYIPRSFTDLTDNFAVTGIG